MATFTLLPCHTERAALRQNPPCLRHWRLPARFPHNMWICPILRPWMSVTTRMVRPGPLRASPVRMAGFWERWGIPNGLQEAYTVMCRELMNQRFLKAEWPISDEAGNLADFDAEYFFRVRSDDDHVVIDRRGRFHVAFQG